MKKRSMVMILVLALMMSTALTGCGGGDGGNDGGSEAKDTLIVAQGTDVTSIDPHKSNERASISVYGQIFDTLVITNESMEAEPCIAESWEFLSDTELQFHIRKDITFQNGDPLTAADVAFSIERIMESPYVAYTLDFVSSVEQTDDYTVVVKMDSPFGPALAHFSHPSTAIVPKALVEADEEGFGLNPVGTGPYKLAEWKHGEYVKLEAYDDCFRGAPKTKKVTIDIMPENSQRFIALESGEIDAAYDISPNDVSKAEGNEALRILSEPSLACMYLTMNVKKEGPLADKMVRKAIEAAVDKEGMISAVAYGNGEAANILIPPGAVGYSDQVKGSEYSVEKAKEYMKQSAYPDGCSLTLWVDDNATKIELCNILQNQLKQIGIEVKLEIMEFSTLLSKLNDGKHDLVLEEWTTTAGDANYTLYAVYNSQTTPYEGNDSFYSNPEADRLIELGRSQFQLEDRMKAYEPLYEIVMDDLPYLPIYYPYDSIALSKKVEGFTINPKGNHQLKDVVISQ